MEITLNRYMTNRTVTHGHLTIGDQTFETLERAIPWDRQSYVKHCLPAGTYPLYVESSLLEFSKGTVRKPWLFFQRVMWFPKAALISHHDSCPLLPGRIFIGIESKDEWSVEDSDVTTARIASLLLPIYNKVDDCATEPINLVITEQEDMLMNDYTKEQYDNEQKALQEKLQENEAEEYLNSLL